jgi:prevent-host-death family protein
MNEITVEDARKTLGDLVTGVANDGEHWVITKNGVRTAQLVPATPADLSRQRYERAPHSKFILRDPCEIVIRRTGQEVVMVYDGHRLALPVDLGGGEAAARIDLAWGPRVRTDD